ncbi:phosphonate transport system substrate-binding protein [Desulfovibrio intestinalis]|uniref:Phosphonate transport system substrate-binding protein n=2 Tax=Desulfovibrio intestinalis TaxID=58621 RepID=A0A7W8C065_9BACT|nr:phosphonate transport system substrate-binding protein [Desulfovibrio intestinalis]
MPATIFAQDPSEAATTASGQKLRVAVAPMMSPSDTFASYFRLLQYLGSQLGMELEFVQRKTHAEVRELLHSNSIDMAFICSGPYALDTTDTGQNLLAMPVVQGESTYQSYVIVHASSQAKSLNDLSDKTFAFTDPDSNTGYLNPVFLLRQAGYAPESFFRSTIFTHSHDNSILAVARGLVDAAAVNSLVWDYSEARRPELTGKTKVLVKSGAFAIPPVVTSAGMDDSRRNKIRDILLHMHENPQGRAMLQELRIDRFVVPEDAWYANVRHMAAPSFSEGPAHGQALP